MAVAKAVTAIIVLGVLAAAVYVGGCALRPFGRCRRCGGFGTRTGKSLILRRPVAKGCRWCDSTGRRLRWGRHVWNYFGRLYREGTR